MGYNIFGKSKMLMIKWHSLFTLLLHTLLATTAYGQNKTTDTAKKEQQLKEVTVNATRNAIETAPGKTIINVQEVAGNAGKNALEILRRVPGVSVDGRGNISVSGKQGVSLLVNGRAAHLGGDDLRDFLEAMTAEEIAQIELITQPSAHYDAEGSAGIINIKTRKLRRKGFNGNATLTGTKSIYEATHNTVLVNYRKDKTNWFVGVNNIIGRNTVFWKQQTLRNDPNGNGTSTMLLESVPVEHFNKYDLRAGADCNYSPKTSMGFSLTGAYYANQMNSPIIIETKEATNNKTQSVRNTYEHSLRRNVSGNIYLKHMPGKKSEINVNGDYLLNTKRLYQYLHTETHSGGIPLPDQLILRSKVPINISVYSGTADFSTQATTRMKLETGAKYSYVIVDNAAYFMNYTGTNWQNDLSRTNRFLYTERIGAAYVNAVKKVGERWDMQLGLRGEYALLSGLQEATGDRLERRLPALFPTIYISYKPDSANNISLNYGRRVQRPQYGMLNPFNYYTFYGLYQRGNAQLLPQYAHNVELKHVYKNHLTSFAEISMITNNITYVSMPDPNTAGAYGTPVNFKANTVANVGISYHKAIRPWWEVMANATGKYGAFRGLYNNIEVYKEGIGGNVSVHNTFKKGKWGGDAYASYNTEMVGSPVSVSKPSFYSNVGVSRKMMADKLTVKVNMDDPFYLYRSGNVDMQPGLANYGSLRSNSRYVTLVVTYMFGKGQEKGRGNKTPDEAKRL